MRNRRAPEEVAHLQSWEVGRRSRPPDRPLWPRRPQQEALRLPLDRIEESDALDRNWFGEVWFPVAKPMRRAQYAWSTDASIDPRDLDLEPRRQEPDLCFRVPRLEILPMLFWTVEPHMCCCQEPCRRKYIEPSHYYP